MVSMNSKSDGQELERAESCVADASKICVSPSSHAYSTWQCIMYSFLGVDMLLDRSFKMGPQLRNALLPSLNQLCSKHRTVDSLMNIKQKRTNISF